MLNLRQLETKKISAEEVRADYLLFESSSDEYRYQMAEDHEFYLGSQLTKSQKNYLLSVGQPPEANNKIRPAAKPIMMQRSSLTNYLIKYGTILMQMSIFVKHVRISLLKDWLICISTLIGREMVV